MTQPKQKKIVTRKLSNKVSQLLTDFLCTDKLTYWMLKDIDRVFKQRETMRTYFNFYPVWSRGWWLVIGCQHILQDRL